MTDRIRPPMRRFRIAIVAATLFCVAGLAVPVVAGPHDADPRQLDRFMWGLAGQESGWDYYARNPHSGAFGRYQIMPVNWPGWARSYLGDGWFDPNPANQERVARGKVNGLYRWLGEWRMVAYWWLTGDSDPVRSHWSAGARRYVDNVLALMGRAPKRGSPFPVDVAGDTGFQVNPGDWRVLVRNAYLRSSYALGHHKLRSIAPGAVFQVRKVGLWPRSEILWLKVRMADGKIGWLNARASLPATPPETDR